MPVKLKTDSWSKPSMLIPDAEYVTVVEMGQTEDRLRRILYDRIANIVVWRRLPWFRMLLFSAALGVIAWAFFAAKVAEAGIVTLIVLAVVLIRYGACGKTFVRICRAGEDRQFVFRARPAKVQRFLRTLRENIEFCQRAAAQKAREREREAAPLEEGGEGERPAAAEGEAVAPVAPREAPGDETPSSPGSPVAEPPS